jgi:hypothetical protein
MRSLLILGGFVGFLLGIIVGVTGGTSWPTILWRSSIGALVGGLVFRWWGVLWMRSLDDAQRQRQDAGLNRERMPSSNPTTNPGNE